MQVAASQEYRHLTLTDYKSTAALHNKPTEGAFVEKCVFRVTLPIAALFSKPTYKVGTQAGHFSSERQANTCFHNTGAGLSIFKSKPIQEDGKHKVKNRPTTNFQSAIKKPITLLRTIIPFVQIGSLHVKVCFGRVENMDADVFQSTPFIDR